MNSLDMFGWLAWFVGLVSLIVFFLISSIDIGLIENSVS